MATITAKTLKGKTAGKLIETLSEELNQTQLAWLAKQDEDKVITAPQASNLMKMEDDNDDAEGGTENAFVFSTEHKPGIHLAEGSYIKVLEDPRARYSKDKEGNQRFLTRNSRGENVMTFTVLLESATEGRFELVLSQREISWLFKKSFEEFDLEESYITEDVQKTIKGYADKTMKLAGKGIYIIEDEKSNFSLNVDRDRLTDGGRMAMAIDHFESLSEEEKLEIGTDDYKEVFLHYQPRKERPDGTMPEVRGQVIDPQTTLKFLPYGEADVFTSRNNLKVESLVRTTTVKEKAAEIDADIQVQEMLFKMGRLTEEQLQKNINAIILGATKK